MCKMASLVEYMKLCRLCLVKDSVNVPIFGEESNMRQLFLKITACLPVKVSQDDELPKKICDQCLYKVELLYHFWNTTMNAEKQLIEWFSARKYPEPPPSPAPSSPLHSKSQKVLPKMESIMLKEECPDLDLRDNDFYSEYENTGDEQTQRTSPQIQQMSETSPPAKRLRGRPPKHKQQPQTGTNTTERTEVVKRERKQRKTNRNTTSNRSESTDENNESSDQFTIAKEEIESEDEENVDNPSSPFPSPCPPEPTAFVGVPSLPGCDDEDKPGPSGVTTTSDSTTVAQPGSSCPASTAPDPPKDLAYLKVLHEAENFTSLLGPNNRWCKEYKCSSCPKTFKYRSKFLNHSIKHIKTKSCLCPVCEKPLKSLVTMRIHMKQHSTKRYKCDVCLKKYALKAAYLNHLKTYPPSTEFTCQKCPQKFHTKYELLVHVTKTHQDSFRCYSCGLVFPDTEQLKVHVEVHNSSPTQPQPQPQPGVLHSKYQCEFCGKKLACRQSLNVHLRSLHLDLRSVICDICGKKLSAKRSLDEHMIIHRGEKPLACERCGKQFAKKNTLRIHLRTHTGERPHACPHCDKRFTQRNSLVVHVRKHTGDRPYSCDLCGEAFISKSCLKIHRKSKHQLL